MDFDVIPGDIATQAVLLGCAFVLAAIIGIEREVRHKSAGARTHILVGLGSALFTLVSVYGFAGMVDDETVRDPGRIAAQIVTGIGFLGAGVIFVRQNVVSGLTTAASIWVSASVGMACGAGMPLIGALAVVFYLLTVTVVNALVEKLRRPELAEHFTVEYEDGKGVLRDILEQTSRQGYESSLNHTRRVPNGGRHRIEAELRFTPRQSGVERGVFEILHDIEGVHSVEINEQVND